MGMMAPPPMMAAPYYEAQQPVPLVDPVRVLQSLRRKVAA
jgi:hypothetical protein